MRLFATVLALLLLSACRLPEWRLGQAEVPPPLEVTPEQREAWRQGADFVAKTIEGPVETVYVADELSSSLGAPEEPLKDPDEVVRELRDAYRRQELALQDLMGRLARYEGKAIEGTGIDLAPWGGGFGLLLIVAACILFPGFSSVLFFLYRRARLALSQVAAGVQQFQAEKPSEAAPLLNHLSRKMDTNAKVLVRKLKP